MPGLVPRPQLVVEASQAQLGPASWFRLLWPGQLIDVFFFVCYPARRAELFACATPCEEPSFLRVLPRAKSRAFCACWLRSGAGRRGLPLWEVERDAQRVRLELLTEGLQKVDRQKVRYALARDEGEAATRNMLDFVMGYEAPGAITTMADKCDFDLEVRKSTPRGVSLVPRGFPSRA